MKDYSQECKELIDIWIQKGIEFGKPVDFLEFRNGTGIKDLVQELLKFKKVRFTEKQIREREQRYKTYHVYSNTKGRVFVITFRNKLRIITIYTLGAATIKRYKAKFKS